ncbi:MAG: hypothetical protein JXN65_01365 [Clostridia bacterium]|nr:hypothetical protein [Clostridia bacterium]
MNTDAFVKLYKDRGYDDNAIDSAVKTLIDAEKFLKANESTFEDATIGLAKKYISYLIETGENSLDALLAVARYFYLIKNNEVYIHFTKVLGGLGVIENIKKRMETFAGKEIAEKVIKGFTMPPLGTPLEEMPKYTNDLIGRLKAGLEPKLYRKILAGNNHGIPEESMKMEKEFYENSELLDTYLKERHQRKVEELQRYCDSETVWFEQIINQDVVDFVKGNQEVLSAVRKGNKLYVTKIPYDIISYLKETDPVKKCYYACHCPFARESIVSDEKNTDSEWCYCSAGFAKFPFEVILGRELDIKLLKSALAGDEVCRFEIDLGEVDS